MSSLRRASLTKKFDGKRFSVWRDYAYGWHEASRIARDIRKLGYKARVVRKYAGWFVYFYPSWPMPDVRDAN